MNNENKNNDCFTNKQLIVFQNLHTLSQENANFATQ